MIQNEVSLYSGEKNVEVFRIARQNAVFNLYANRHLDEVFRSYDAPDILDVGCSDGKSVDLRLRGRRIHTLVGIDIDPDKIRQAQAFFPAPERQFRVMDVTAPDFGDRMRAELDRIGIEGFHIIHISSVLMHLPDPASALRNLRPFLLPEGTLFIQDEDDGLNLASPADPFFTDAFYLWDHSLESGDRHSGRKIPGHLEAAGYRDVRLLSTTISSLDAGEELRESFWDVYFNCDLWSADSAEYFDDPGALDLLASYRERQQAYRQAFLDGKYFVLMGIFYFTAKK